jgi:hypothetical protein
MTFDARLLDRYKIPWLSPQTLFQTLAIGVNTCWIHRIRLMPLRFDSVQLQRCTTHNDRMMHQLLAPRLTQGPQPLRGIPRETIPNRQHTYSTSVIRHRHHPPTHSIAAVHHHQRHPLFIRSIIIQTNAAPSSILRVNVTRFSNRPQQAPNQKNREQIAHRPKHGDPTQQRRCLPTPQLRRSQNTAAAITPITNRFTIGSKCR